MSPSVKYSFELATMRSFNHPSTFENAPASNSKEAYSSIVISFSYADIISLITPVVEGCGAPSTPL